MDGHMDGDRSDKISFLSVAGDVDETQMQIVRGAARRHLADGAGALILDLSGVNDLSTEAISALLGLRRDILGVGGRLALIGLPPLVRDKIARLGLSRLLPSHADLEAARAALSSGSTD